MAPSTHARNPGFSLILPFSGLSLWRRWLERHNVGHASVVKGTEMTATSQHTPTTRAAAGPTDGLLTSSLLAAPLLYLAADATYAASGWDDSTAGVLHVLGAIAYGLVALRVAAWLQAESWLAAAIVLCGLIGLAGNVAYGFETIHASFGDVRLVDRSGAANLIKPLGLFFPLSLALVAFALDRLDHRRHAVLVFLAAVAWPIAHIGNIAALAVAVNVALVVAFGSLIGPRTLR